MTAYCWHCRQLRILILKILNAGAVYKCTACGHFADPSER